MRQYSQGQYEKIVSTRRHHCGPLPGWWSRLRDGIDIGSIWRCDCGKRYELTYHPEVGTWWMELKDGASHLAACNPAHMGG